MLASHASYCSVAISWRAIASLIAADGSSEAYAHGSSAMA